MLGGLVSRTLRSSGRGALATTRLLARSSTTDAAPPSTTTAAVDPLSTMDFFGVHRDDVQLGFGLILGLYVYKMTHSVKYCLETPRKRPIVLHITFSIVKYQIFSRVPLKKSLLLILCVCVYVAEHQLQLVQPKF